MHYTDIIENIKKYNAVEKIKQSGIFDDVVIAAADIPENRLLEEYSAFWNVDIRYGSIKNITERIKDIANTLQAKTILRALVHWFFIDVDLVKKMINKLESNGSDYLKLPLDFDIRFAGDVFSINFINKMCTLFEEDPTLMQKYSFNPWGYADIDDIEGIRIIEFNDVPVYDNIQFRKIKTVYNAIWPEHWDSNHQPLHPYVMASKFLVPGESRVLDIACGYGTGTKYLIFD